MPIGKEIGSFSLHSTSLTYSPGTGEVENVQVNMEGTRENDGATSAVLGTMDISPAADALSGTYTWCGREFASDGSTLMGKGAGFYQTSGANKWALRGYLTLSDGSQAAVEGEIDLASRTLSGNAYEWS